MKTFKFLPFVAFMVAVTVATAFPPPPTPMGQTVSIPCEAGVIVGSDNCSTSGHDQCKVLLRGSFQADAFQTACNIDANRLKRN